jgi:hypothetical protein
MARELRETRCGPQVMGIRVAERLQNGSGSPSAPYLTITFVNAEDALRNDAVPANDHLNQ